MVHVFICLKSSAFLYRTLFTVSKPLKLRQDLHSRGIHILHRSYSSLDSVSIWESCASVKHIYFLGFQTTKLSFKLKLLCVWQNLVASTITLTFMLSLISENLAQPVVVSHFTEKKSAIITKNKKTTSNI